jgi:hypothetical protein
MTPQQEREWREHPPHRHTHNVAHSSGVTEVVDPPPPIPGEGVVGRWRRRRECRKRGGHWWHPEGRIDWFCCQCPALTDGSPRDGTSR